ncbi:hypothetical protein [Ancylobacter defluvii]|uniref:Uncharacterized protein n=1 Tax=Ancylobacter defluvii TaxID=1282440 RepID=A0A9W6K0J5_9HYPH|nr:hypothetical protein [Ancylobacter defluvii]MBS7589101.1 hypothetical protein [Ancylobacter defluvii]GLK84713.1 hypothetical protein GCM10017653_27830 [Ancylobacter defluvii]
MVILRVALLGLATGTGIMLGWPAQTSQPAGFVTATAPEPVVPALPAAAPVLTPVSTSGAVPGEKLHTPPAPVLLALLRGTLAAVNQANVTGNYSVLRDLGAPAFRENYNAAELADQFRPWRDNALDFAAILLLDAKLSRPPSIDTNGNLRLKGYFPTAPLRIGFDLGFEAIGGNWRLATISVDARKLEAGDDEIAMARPKAVARPAPPPVKVTTAPITPVPVTKPAASPAPAPFAMGQPPRTGSWWN